MEPDIGIDKKDRQKIVNGLSRTLADTYTLYVKTHNFHFNVVGPQFQTLHLMFETQYNELWLAVDLLAERIRALGHNVAFTPKALEKLSSITIEEGVPKSEEMIRLLVKGHEATTKTAREAFEVADKANDSPTADLLTERMNVHEKTAWMLRSLIEK